MLELLDKFCFSTYFLGIVLFVVGAIINEINEKLYASAFTKLVILFPLGLIIIISPVLIIIQGILHIWN